MRVLVIKMSSLGDVVHALPAISDLVAAGAEVHWVVEEAFAPVAQAHRGVHTVLPIAWRRWRRALLKPSAFAEARREFRGFRSSLGEQEYDLVIDAQGLFKSAVVCRWARAPIKTGFDRDSIRERGAARFYTESVPVPTGWHAVDRLRRLCAVAAGYPIPEPVQFGLAPQRRQRARPLALLLHGTSWRSKEYPEPLWSDLVGLVHSAGYDAALTWGDEAERERAERVAEQTGAGLWARMPLQDLIERMTEVSVVVGVDSGLTHLAAAMGIPTVGLYGASDLRLTGIRGLHAASRSVDFACSPCLNRHCAYTGPGVLHAGQPLVPACLAALSPGAIWHQAQALTDAARVAAAQVDQR